MTKLTIPNLGNINAATVLEVLVKPNDEVKKGTSILVLEGEKSTFDIPCSHTGVIETILVKPKDKITPNMVYATLKADTDEKEPPKAEKPQKQPPQTQVYASPKVRREARNLGINLNDLAKDSQERITIDDLHQQTASNQETKATCTNPPTKPGSTNSNLNDFITKQELSSLKQASGTHLSTSWSQIPLVTQFDAVDITEVEKYRKELKQTKQQKITILSFVIYALCKSLQKFPIFNASLDNKHLLLKHFYHIGIAVQTKIGLCVPVIENADKMSITEIAKQIVKVSDAVNNGDFSHVTNNSTFTVSSLGNIGGTNFTPLVNSPNVAILGVSKAKIEPVYDKGAFMPRLMLPIALSYDHRAIDGAEGAYFCQHFSKSLSILTKKR